MWLSKKICSFCSLSKVKTLVPLDWSTDICVSMYDCQQKYLILIKVSECDIKAIQFFLISHFKSFERRYAGLSKPFYFQWPVGAHLLRLSRWPLQKTAVWERTSL